MRLALLLFFVCLTIALTAQTSINFDGFLGTGISAPAADGEAIVVGQLNGAVFTTNASGGDLSRGTSTGGVSTGGIYAFEVATGNVALGIQPGGSDFTPGFFTLTLYNQSGAAIVPSDMIVVSYTVYTYNDQARSNSFDFSYSTDNSAFTDVAALNHLTPATADGSPAWVSAAKTTTITGISVAEDAPFYIRFDTDDSSGGGSRDEIAVDDISVSIVSILDNSALPVNLTNLTAERNGKTAMVKWSTVSESGNSHFVIERSQDGRNFNEIGRINGSGDSYGIINYDFTDQAPASGDNFYRLRQVDLTGASNLYGPAMVSFERSGVTAYPNPVANRLFVSGVSENSRTTILDFNGKVMRTSLATGNGIATDGLPAGTYLLQIENASGTETLRFVKQ